MTSAVPPPLEVRAIPSRSPLAAMTRGYWAVVTPRDRSATNAIDASGADGLGNADDAPQHLCVSTSWRGRGRARRLGEAWRKIHGR